MLIRRMHSPHGELGPVALLLARSPLRRGTLREGLLSLPPNRLKFPEGSRDALAEC